MSSLPIISILTPTYNRRHTLGRLHESIEAQGRADVEWVVIDDGSEDGTEAFVAALMERASYSIVYRRKPNAGRASALNAGIPLCRGRYALFMDSDDWFSPEAFSTFLREWDAVGDAPDVAAVVGLCASPDGALIGTGFPRSPMDSDFLAIRAEHGVRGDKKELFRGEILRAHPFPTVPGEKRVPTSLILNRMAARYRARFVNAIVCVKDYQEGGMSATIDRIRMRSPHSSRLRYVEALQARLPAALKIRNASNCFRYSLHGRVPLGRQASEVGLGNLLIGVPLGSALFLRDVLRHGLDSRATAGAPPKVG